MVTIQGMALGGDLNADFWLFLAGDWTVTIEIRWQQSILNSSAGHR